MSVWVIVWVDVWQSFEEVEKRERVEMGRRDFKGQGKSINIYISILLAAHQCSLRSCREL